MGSKFGGIAVDDTQSKFGGIPLPEDSQSEGFGARVMADIQKRVDTSDEILRTKERGDQGAISTGLQMVGNVGAGAINDVVGEAIHSVASLLPDAIKDPVKKGIQSVMGTSGVQDAVRNWKYFESQHPEAAANISAGANIGMVAPLAKVGKAGEAVGDLSKSTIGKAGTALEDAAAKQAAQEHTAFVQDLVMGAPDKSSIKRMSKPGIFSGKEVAPSPDDLRVIEAVKDLPGVSKSVSLVENAQAIEQGIGKEAESLIAEVRKNPRALAKADIYGALEDARAAVMDTPLLATNATMANTVDNLITNAKRILNDNPMTSEGVLNARKQFDAFVRRSRPKIFDQNFENAASVAQKEVRNTLNRIVIENNPSAGVAESLGKQSAMYDALDVVGQKALQEPASKAAELFQSVNKLLPEGKKMSPGVAKAIGIGLVGGAATLSPALVAAGAAGMGIYSGGKFILSPAAKRGLSMLLKKTDQAIQLANKPIKGKVSPLLPDTTTPRIIAEGESIAASPVGTEGVGMSLPRMETVPYSRTDIVDVAQPKPERIPGIEIPSAAPESVENLIELRQQLLDTLGGASKELDYVPSKITEDFKASKMQRLADKYPRKGSK